jgi:hypothetical protein
MIVLKEKRRLIEMAQFKAAGIILKVYSDDHGIFGNADSPAHAHVFDSTGKKELGIVVLTSTPPQTPTAVQWFRTPNPSEGLAKAIVKFANTPNPVFKKFGGKYAETLWEVVVQQWFTFHGR